MTRDAPPLTLATLAIGDELLDGRVVDTNSQRLATALFELGVTIDRAATVSDDVAAISEVLTSLASRCDLIITSGGLGPTSDDVTAEAVALAAGCATRLDEVALRSIVERFQARGLAMPENNKRQAEVPVVATCIQNGAGISPAFVTRVGAAEVWSLPGVPSEYDWFVAEHLVPTLQSRVGGARAARLRRRTLRCLGITESQLGHVLASFEAAHPAVRVQYRTSFPENHVRLVVEGTDEAADALAAEARAAIGGAVYALGEDPLEVLVVNALRRRQETLALAESCTGGLLGGRITDVPGCSDVFLGGVVAYHDAVKVDALSVDATLLNTHGAVSEEVAAAMAEGARTRTGATWGVSITGVAGPGGGTEEKPVGTVCFGLAGPEGTETKRRLMVFPGRDRVRALSVAVALRWLLQKVS